jgi:3-hydroxybutyryl-CoA dehydrogenase
MIDPTGGDVHIGVVGAGAMGQGILQVALTGGMAVTVHDAADGAAARAVEAVFQRIARMVEKGQLGKDEAAAARRRVTVAGDLAAMRDCHAVIEAVFENLELKQKVFADLEAVVAGDCVLASNTSSLLIASIARACRNRSRIAGMHFFNPVPLMKLVEVVRGPDTAEEVIAFLTRLGVRMGRVPVTVKDAPGFLVNLGGRAYSTEAMRILHERVASPAQIDAVMRDCCGFRMGPLELADLTGIDVNYPVSLFIYDGYNQDPRLKTSFPHRSLYEAGRLGRKTGHGSYRYGAGGERLDEHTADFVPSGPPAAAMSLAEVDETAYPFLAGLGAQILDHDDGKSPIVAALLGEDCSSHCVRTGRDHRRLVGIDLSCDTSRRVTLMQAPGADPAAADAVAALLRANGRAVTLIKDSPGFVSQRIRAMIANLGCEMAQIGIAAPLEIDTAMRLGLNYPLGPLELAERMGVADTLAILERLQATTGEDRYRPSLWLKRRAGLGLAIHTPD